MEEFKANYGFNALIMFSFFTALFLYVTLKDEHWHFYTIYPFMFYLIPFIYNSRANYKISAEALTVEKIFSKKIIPTNRIRRVEILENKKWLQVLNGKPKLYVSIKYNKFDEIFEYPENPEKFQELLLKHKEA